MAFDLFSLELLLLNNFLKKLIKLLQSLLPIQSRRFIKKSNINRFNYIHKFGFESIHQDCSSCPISQDDRD